MRIGNLALGSTAAIRSTRSKVRHLALAMQIDPIDATRLSSALSSLARRLGDAATVTVDVETSPATLALTIPWQESPEPPSIRLFFDEVSWLSKGESRALHLLIHTGNSSFRPSQHFIDEQRKALREPSREELMVSLQRSNLALRQQSEELERTVTERTADLRAETARAEKANTAKSLFLTNMSHEIRTPMNSVLGFAEILEQVVTDKRQLRYVQSIRSSGKSLLGLINDVLDLSKVEAGKLELALAGVSLKAVCDEIRSIFGQKCAEKDIELIIVTDALPPALVLDEIRLRQCLINLIGNAIKFTDQGSVELTVRASQPDDNSSVELLFAVADTGRGIPTDQQPIVFGAFEQVRGQDLNKYGGSGLGLSITKNLVKLMGGEISLRSEEGRGSTFTLRFPSVPIAAVADLKDSDTSLIHFKPATVLCVDDIPTNRALIVAFFGDEPLLIEEAKDGVEALARLAGGGIDLVLTDLKMPRMGGFELTRRIKENPMFAHIPVVALTASALLQTESQVRELCDGYLRKPVQGSMLFGELARFLDHERKRAAEPQPATVEPILHSAQAAAFVDSAMLSMPPASQLSTLAVRLQQRRARWSELRASMDIQGIEAFGAEMTALGTAHSYPKLSEWGAAVVQQAQMFDMDALVQSLDLFDEIT